MSFKTTGILAVILILLGAYYYIFEVVQHEKEEKQKETAQQLFDFESDSVDVIKVKNQYGEFEFKKVQGEWRITEPLYTGAEETTVNSALNNLTGAKKDKEFSINPGDKRDYGLADRPVKVWLTLRNGSVDSLILGDKTPVGSSVFVSKTDTLVYTVPQNIKTSLDKKLFDWRNKNLLSFNRNDVQKMVIHKPGQKYEFEKTGSTDWTFQTIERPANTGTINSIISKLENNKAKAFVDEEGTESKKYGLQNPRYQIDLFLGEEKGKKSLAISGQINNKYYAKDESREPIFEIDSALVKDIRKPQSDFRDKKLAEFDQNSIDRVVIQYNDTLITCVKDTSDEWYLDEPDKPSLKKANLTSFLSNINSSTIKEFVADGQFNLNRYGLDKPNLEIQLFQGDSRKLELKFGKEANSDVYAMTDQYKAVYLLPKYQYTRLKLERSKILEEPVSLPDTTTSPTQ